MSKTGGLPNQLAIYHNQKGKLGFHIKKVERLYEDDAIDTSKKRWIEHPKWGEQADFVALSLTQYDEVEFSSHDLINNYEEMLIEPSEAVSIVGFPFGKGSTTAQDSKIAIWVDGRIASEPEIDDEGFPRFIVNCQGCPGLSGSPVIAYRNGTPVRTKNEIRHHMEPVQRFLGIYSGRLNKHANLGYIWKSSAIMELINSLA